METAVMDKIKIKQNDIAGSNRRKHLHGPEMEEKVQMVGDAERGIGHVEEEMAESSSSVRGSD